MVLYTYNDIICIKHLKFNFVMIQKAVQRDKELKAKDAARKKLQDEKNRELAKANAFARAEAEKRQEAALATWLGFLQKRKDDYEAKVKVIYHIDEFDNLDCFNFDKFILRV